MKRLNAITENRNSLRYVALALVLIAPALMAQPAAAPTAPATANAYKWKTPKLNRAQIDGLLAHPEKLVIIDVRRPDELTKIGGFPVYLNIQANDLEKYLAFIPKDRSILTASNHAGRAGAAGDLLTSKGFNVAGAVGVQNYEEEGGQLVKVQPPAPKPAIGAIN
jgi:rhodanese-related sulfurtransferase